MDVLYNKYIYISTTVILVLLFNFLLFSTIFRDSSSSIRLFEEYTVIIDENIWHFIKTLYFPTTALSWGFISYSFFSKNPNIFKKESVKSHQNENIGLSLNLGNNMYTGEEVIIPEKGLYQNILITGTIGTGKTSSAMYPFLDQLLKQNLGMLILDVKGNFHKKVLELNQIYKRNVIVIEINRQIQV